MGVSSEFLVCFRDSREGATNNWGPDYDYQGSQSAILDVLFFGLVTAQPGPIATKCTL